MTKKIPRDREKISTGDRESQTDNEREGDMFVMAGLALACGWVDIKNSSSSDFYDLGRLKYQFESLHISFGMPVKHGRRRDGRREIDVQRT